MPFCTSCGTQASNSLCPDCFTPRTAVVAKTLNAIAYSFAGFMAFEALGLFGFFISTLVSGAANFTATALVLALLPVGLGLVVWSLCKRTKSGDASSLLMLKVVIAIIGVLGFFGVAALLTPLITAIGCLVAFIFISIPTFNSAFDAIATERTSFY